MSGAMIMTPPKALSDNGALRNAAQCLLKYQPADAAIAVPASPPSNAPRRMAAVYSSKFCSVNGWDNPSSGLQDFKERSLNLPS